MSEQAEIQFGREICGDLEVAESREWLVTNGIGGYASGTIAGSQTRRYHGLLVAALQPPLGRTQLVSTIDEIAHYAEADFSLAAHRWASGTVDPKGFLFLEDFHLEGSTPVWTYALADALLEKRVWMRQGKNTTYIQYTFLRGGGPLELEIKALVNYRDFHSLTHAGDWHMNISPAEHGIKVQAFDGATPFFLKSSGASCEPRHEWYLDCYFAEETARGLSDREDRLFAGLFRAKLEVGSSVTLIATTESTASLDGETSRAERANHDVKLFQGWQAKNEDLGEEAPSWLWQLILAADQFIVKRSLPEEPEGRSIIAGYHWFGDWGRDTMIALPGLTLTTGRPGVALQILLAFSRYVDGGMLPNNFPDAGGNPEYNTVDAALWFFEAIRQYVVATQDTATLQSLFPVLAGMIDAHIAGTRYNIHVDPADGLLYAGVPGVQLTWMDAKISDWVVTPRTGKAVEINALWINALETMAGFARLLAKPGDAYEQRAAKTKNSFQTFWNADRNCCFDVIDSPGIGNDASLRPNQIFAVSLPVSPLTPEQRKAVVDVCARHLLTSHGLRSLAPGEPGYSGHYGGSPSDRDAAYHQGTVWGWLLGPFALAHYRVYHDRKAALRFLEPLGRQIYASGLGTLSEIFDGDPRFTPRGCIAQAWTVAEVLRVWHEIASGKKLAIR
ncbi:MAG TPA: amylo-alpha-1,6-glucosidase [Candidatus Polarisedimenticolia bacterium]|nr:amylo-alpha-1,6-glucosidase [Candidatus Polarisedimenticolia bacterium]